MPCSASWARWSGWSRRARSAGEDRGVEGLDAPAEDLVRLGQVGDRPHAGNALLGEVGARAVGGETLDLRVDEAACELDDPFTVRDGEEGAQSTTSLRFE